MINSILKEVAQEREKQDSKWGEQNHAPCLWNGILLEEVGEVSKEVNDHTFEGKGINEMREELIQVAAVAVAWIECLDRNA